MNPWSSFSPPQAPPHPVSSYQPIHPKLRPLLDPEYVEYHEHHVQFLVPDEQKNWEGSVRVYSSLPASPSLPMKVGLLRDLQLENCRVRVFVPESSQHVYKYPALLWFHGGGWVSGDLDSDHDLLTYLCQSCQCIVVTVDYRLAPEHPYPAAAEDAIEALVWLMNEAPKYYAIDVARVAVGGTEAGGNIAAVLVLEAACLFPSFKPIFMLLIVPVIDNTATPGEGWWNTNAPWLTPARMLWCRGMYLPYGHTNPDGTDEREQWQISPNLAQTKILAQAPSTWIAVAEHDLLATEALAFSSQLRAAGVTCKVKVYSGCPHPILTLSGALTKGQELLLDAAQALTAVFWPVRLDPFLGWTLVPG